MSGFTIIPSGMHKIAEFFIDVKYRRPGNVVEYLPVEFEVFKDGSFFNAIPLPTFEMKTLTNLRNEYVFQIKDGKAYDYPKGTEEIVDGIVRKMAQMNIVEMHQESCAEIGNKSRSYSAIWS